jgi:hypothetical protein
MDPEIRKAYLMYAMDFTAKEACKVALNQNGLQIVLEGEEDEDEGMWGDLDNIRLLDADMNPIKGQVFCSVEDAVEYWTPGQGFSFVVRNVPAKLRELTLDEIMEALDPSGEYKKQAQHAELQLPDEDLHSLKDLAYDNMRRVQEAPRGAVDEKHAFPGEDEKRGYRVISRSELIKSDNNSPEDEKIVLHVMDALVSHGALIVDLTDGGANFALASKVSLMWNTTRAFFQSLDDDPTLAKYLPQMTSIPASPHAKVGYQDSGNGMQFLETRLMREGGSLVPSEARGVLGREGEKALEEAFGVIVETGKDVIRIATAASTMEHFGFVNFENLDRNVVVTSTLEEGKELVSRGGGLSAVKASQGATQLANEIVDNGKILEDINVDEGMVSMSPHRLCRYWPQNEYAHKEVFGAHTDSSFVTIVPVADVSGLEVYDEAAEQWYRPELRARLEWQKEREARGLDKDALFETFKEGNDDLTMPWYARYIVIMPGDFLQIVTRNEVPASVHRVVAGGPTARMSAPILLRGRPGTKLDVERYLGEVNEDLLEHCNGMSMQDIHDQLQLSAYQ